MQGTLLEYYIKQIRECEKLLDNRDLSCLVAGRLSAIAQSMEENLVEKVEV